MKNELKLTITIFSACALLGCASHPEPIVDMKGVSQSKYKIDWKECKSYSEKIKIQEGSAKGAATGSVIGAATGTIRGDTEKNTGYGAIIGATRSGLNADKENQAVFKRCLRGRGYRVLN